MTPAALNFYRRLREHGTDEATLAADRLGSVAQHFYVNDDLVCAAAYIAESRSNAGHDISDWPVATLPEPIAQAARLPAKWVTIQEGDRLFILSTIEDLPKAGAWGGEAFALSYVEAGGKDFQVCAFTPGRMKIYMPDVADYDRGKAFSETALWHLHMVIALLELMNSPNVVEVERSQQSRQVRRKMVREGAPGDAAYTIVRFRGGQIRRLSRAEASRESGNALHYRRGHWRRPTSRCQHPERLPDAHMVDGEYRNWIEGQWVGDPTSGICLHSYEAFAPSEAAWPGTPSSPPKR